MRITAPSPIKAVLSATATSLAGASLPRCCDERRDRYRTTRRPASRPSARSPDSPDRTVPARMRRRRRPGGASRRRRASRRPFLARALAAASGGAASGFASRISARRSVYFHSSTRRCGRPSLANTPKAASRCAAIASSPGSVPRARAKSLRQRGLRRGLDRGDLRRSRHRLLLILGIAARLELERQLLAAGLHDAAARTARARCRARCRTSSRW